MRMTTKVRGKSSQLTQRGINFRRVLVCDRLARTITNRVMPLMADLPGSMKEALLKSHPALFLIFKKLLTTPLLVDNLCKACGTMSFRTLTRVAQMIQTIFKMFKAIMYIAAPSITRDTQRT